MGKSVTLVEDADRKLMKEVVKQSRAHIQQRVVPQAAIKHWAARIERLAPDIERLVEASSVLLLIRFAHSACCAFFVVDSSYT